MDSRKVRPSLCSSMVKCSFLITVLLPLRALQSYSYQGPSLKEPGAKSRFQPHILRGFAGDAAQVETPDLSVQMLIAGDLKRTCSAL